LFLGQIVFLYALPLKNPMKNTHKPHTQNSKNTIKNTNKNPSGCFVAKTKKVSNI
jgi:hypothetical protein